MVPMKGAKTETAMSGALGDVLSGADFSVNITTGKDSVAESISKAVSSDSLITPVLIIGGIALILMVMK